jgi:hypothetical protein
MVGAYSAVNPGGPSDAHWSSENVHPTAHAGVRRSWKVPEPMPVG